MSPGSGGKEKFRQQLKRPMSQYFKSFFSDEEISQSLQFKNNSILSFRDGLARTVHLTVEKVRFKIFFGLGPKNLSDG